MDGCVSNCLANLLNAVVKLIVGGATSFEWEAELQVKSGLFDIQTDGRAQLRVKNDVIPPKHDHRHMCSAVVAAAQNEKPALILSARRIWFCSWRLCVTSQGHRATQRLD